MKLARSTTFNPEKILSVVTRVPARASRIPLQNEQQVFVVRLQKAIVREGFIVLREPTFSGRPEGAPTFQPLVHLLQEREQQAQVGGLLLVPLVFQKTGEDMADLRLGDFAVDQRKEVLQGGRSRQLLKEILMFLQLLPQGRQLLGG